MEITKQNETFTLTETTDVYEIKGNISRDNNGSLNVHFSFNKIDGEFVGDGHYSKYADNERVNFGVNCPEEIREEIAECADLVVDSVLAHFNSNI